MSKPSHAIPPTSLWVWVDVRDVAEAHLKAFEVPEAGRQRFLIAEGKYSYQRIVDILRDRMVEVRDRVPVGKPRSGLGDVYGIDASKSENVLGLRYRPLRRLYSRCGRVISEAGEGELILYICTMFC